MSALVIECDFLEDWRSLLIGRLHALEQEVRPPFDADSVTVTYFNALRRHVLPRPRKVLIAKTFPHRPEFEPALCDIMLRCETGGSLVPFQSKRVVRSSHDALLNAWDIHHFHLGETLDLLTGFRERTGALLFARVTSDAMYWITIGQHGDWTDLALVDVLHANWPESLARYRLYGISPGGVGRDPKAIRALRRKNVNLLVETLDGVTYAPLGGGSASSGLNIMVRRDADFWLAHVRGLQEHAQGSAAAIASELRGRDLDVPRTLMLTLEECGGVFQATSLGGKLRVRFGHISDTIDRRPPLQL